MRFGLFFTCLLMFATLAVSAQTIEKSTLCKSVEDLEPIDQTSEFLVGERAYFWMKVNEAEVGQEIIVAWYLNENLIHTTKLTLNLASMRTFAYKTMNAAGNWKVTVLNKDRLVLEEKSFTAK